MSDVIVISLLTSLVLSLHAHDYVTSRRRRDRVKGAWRAEAAHLHYVPHD